MELRKALFNMAALSDLGGEITSERDFNGKLRSFLHVILGTFLASKGAIACFSKSDNALSVVAGKGFDAISFGNDDIRRLRAAAPNEPFRPEDDPSFSAAGVSVAAPLWVRDEFIGAILLGSKFTGDAYTAPDLELLTVIAHQIAIALNNHSLFLNLSEQVEENRRLYEEMRRIYHDTLQAFAAAIDAKDIYTRHHSQRVARYASAIARELGWSDHDIEGIYVAGFLHDVGKLVISNELLNKKTPFTEEELQEIRKHSLVSYKIISQIKFPWKDVEKIIRHHHERLDGTGYPDALSRSDLSEGAKILTLADSFDAMTSERAYRQKMDLRSALIEMSKCINRQFDDRIMLAFCRVLDREIKGELSEPDILPHFDRGSDLTVISSLLEGLIEELEKSRD